MEFKLLIDAKVTISETPVWDHRLNRLYWTDFPGGELHSYHPQTGEEQTWSFGKPLGVAIPCENPEKMFIALADGLYLLDLETSETKFICDPDPRPDYMYNDSRIDAAGRILTSSVSKIYGSDAYSPDMLGNFYVVDTDGTVTTLVEGVNQYNGMVWNKSSTKMYVVDTHNQKLLVFPYDIDRGPTGGCELELDLKDLGMPDGIGIDEEDSIYICHWTGKISVWDKDLNLTGTIPFPVEFVCCLGFGGDDKKDLYVATASYNYTEADFKKNPGAGGLFIGRSNIAGRPDNFYKAV